MARSQLLGFALVSLAGCGDAARDAPDAGADAPVVDASPPPVMASGTVVEAAGSAPLAGARVCLPDAPAIPCATTDANGAYKIALPPWTTEIDLAVNVTAAGHLGFTGLTHQTTIGVVWFSEIPLMDDAAASAMLHAQAGFAYPAPGKAFVLFSVFRASGGAATGATATLSPASGSGPVYAQPSGTLDPTLAATTTNGYLVFGGVTPGKLSIAVAGVPCTPVALSAGAWAGPTPGTVAGEAAANSMTRMTAICQ
jgi:hypothetical protein